MSQLPQILFHTQLPTSKPRLMVRNSDDFFPDIPSSHPFHIFTNALTSLLTSHLNVLPDWDMFQTSHPYSSFHAAARAISGGPIYITDTPGQHSLPLIHAMTAPTISPYAPKTIILRPNRVAKCIEQGIYTPYQAHKFLQVGNYHSGSTADYGTSLLGVFNVSEEPLTELIPLSHFPGVRPEQKYVIRAYPSGDISPPMALGDEFAVVDLALETKGWGILTAYPLVSAPRSSGTSSPTLSSLPDTEIAVVGLLPKLTSACAIVSTPTLTSQPNKSTHLTTTLCALGTLGIYISTLPSMTKPSATAPSATEPYSNEASNPEEWKSHILVLIRDRAVPVHT
ncbi:MAG: hypothetical protein LQ346_008096, partial [Caloplaca aetnensis]